MPDHARERVVIERVFAVGLACDGPPDPEVGAPHDESLSGTFVVYLLQPWHENVRKRQVQRPKVFLSDTGTLHALLGLRSREDVEGHPIVWTSWEGFAQRQVVAALRARPEEAGEHSFPLGEGVQATPVPGTLPAAPTSARSRRNGAVGKVRDTPTV